MEVWPVLFVLLLVSSVNGYNIRINPIVKTSVTSLKNQGDNNSIQFSSISNSTILQAVPQQLYQSHYNELLSTSVILVIFTFSRGFSLVMYTLVSESVCESHLSESKAKYWVSVE